MVTASPFPQQGRASEVPSGMEENAVLEYNQEKHPHMTQCDRSSLSCCMGQTRKLECGRGLGGEGLAPGLPDFSNMLPTSAQLVRLTSAGSWSVRSSRPFKLCQLWDWGLEDLSLNSDSFSTLGKWDHPSKVMFVLSGIEGQTCIVCVVPVHGQ